MKIETQAEILKLSRLLENDESELSFLIDQSPERMRRMRAALSGFYYERHQDSYHRLASLSKLLPLGASAKLATTLLGTVLSAGIASELPPERAIKLARKLPDEFLARLCLHLEPGHSLSLLQVMPEDVVSDVARELLAMKEYITLARFVGVIPQASLEVVTATLTDGEAMVKIGLYLEDKSKLNTVLGLLSDDQQRATLLAATEHELWPAVLSLNAHLNHGLRAKMGNMVAEQGEDVLTHIIHIASEQVLWPGLLQAVNAMDNAHQQMIVNLPALREPAVMNSLVSSVLDEGNWDELLAMLPLLDPEHLHVAVDALVSTDGAALADALAKAADSDLLGLMGHLPDSEIARVATAISHHARDAYQAFVERNPQAQELALLNKVLEKSR